MGKLAILGGKPVRSKPFTTWPIVGEEDERCLVRVLKSGNWGKLTGEEVVRFERRFADYHEARHGVAIVNGTTGLRLALQAMDINAGDEVIVPPLTFFATASAVVEVNAKPVFVDIDLDTFNIDPCAIENSITPRTRAIIPVHFGGLPVDMDAIMEIARRHDLTVIEDAAHAHGAEYKGRRVGSIGHMSMFSFQSSKNVSCGEGGIVLTNDENLAEKLWSLHNCGRLPNHAWYEHFILGANLRLGEFQGALLNTQWDRFDQQAKTREENGRYLAQRLNTVPGIYPQARDTECTRHAYHLFSFRVDPNQFGVPRTRFLEAMSAEGIPATSVYPEPLYRQPVFEQKAYGPYASRDSEMEQEELQSCCPNCETITYEQGVWLEHHLLLGDLKDMDDIVAAVSKIHENRVLLGDLQQAGH